MSKKQYYKREYGEEYYIFDSLIISEDILEKRIEYEGYTAFEDSMTGDEIVNLLNEQQDTIITLKERLEKINGGYGDLTHRNGLTANEWLIEGQEKEIKRKDEQISEWIEQHSKDIAKISEQNKLIQNLKEENERLKNKLNVTALELVDESISMGKAVEISEMNYHEFLEYRQKKGKPMELQI